MVARVKVVARATGLAGIALEPGSPTDQSQESECLAHAAGRFFVIARRSFEMPRSGGILTAALAGAFAFIAASVEADEPVPIVVPATATSSVQTPAPVKTGKERLSSKASDEQRVDNCKVPPELRGTTVRPDACESKSQTIPTN
jgi:hypothetical protein